ncbi:MAG: nickel-dependent lactate racemase, partial [Promethearchaeota archaeon]
MVEVELKYGEEAIYTDISDKNFLGVIASKKNPNNDNPIPNLSFENAINNPVDKLFFDKLFDRNDKISIVINDNTRITPSKEILPVLLNRLDNLGIKEENIEILIAVGSHRPVTEKEMEELLGKEIVSSFVVENHNCQADDLVNLGMTHLQTPVELNRKFVEADKRITIGDVAFHYYAGYTGGRKSILPGISSLRSIQKNHSNLIHPDAVTGNLEGNVIHVDMTEAAKRAKVDFCISVVLDSNKEIVFAAGGGIISAFNKCVKKVDELFKVYVDKPADIVLVSSGGFPKDINLYQAQKAIEQAQTIVKPGGQLVVIAECKDGIGHKVFEEWMYKYKTLEELSKQVQTNFKLGGHKAYYMRKTMLKADIILVSELDPELVKNPFNMTPADSIEDALDLAFSRMGNNASVWTLPIGGETL